MFANWCQPAANFIKFFWPNLRCYWPIGLRFDTGYAARGINYSGKRFMKSSTGSTLKVPETDRFRPYKGLQGKKTLAYLCIRK